MSRTEYTAVENKTCSTVAFRKKELGKKIAKICVVRYRGLQDLSAIFSTNESTAFVREIALNFTDTNTRVQSNLTCSAGSIPE
jgi:hypothetical protein